MDERPPKDQRIAWLLIVGACATFTALTRFGTDAGWSLAGLADELAFTTILALVIGLAARWRPLFAALLSLLTFGFWSMVLLGNELYHRTFNVWISLDQLVNAGEVGAIKDSIASLGGASTLIPFLIVPWLLTVAVAARPPRLAPGRARWLALAVPVLMLLGGALRSPALIPAQNNLMMASMRQFADRTMLRFGKFSPERVLGDLELEVLVPPLPGYARGSNPGAPLWQVPEGGHVAPSRRPNILIVELESLRAAESSSYGAKPGVTPNFDRFAQESLLAKRFYANGIQTVRGELALLCSTWPALGVAALYKRLPETGLRCLPEMLRDAGWSTHWFSAFKANYSGKNSS